MACTRWPLWTTTVGSKPIHRSAPSPLDPGATHGPLESGHSQDGESRREVLHGRVGDISPDDGPQHDDHEKVKDR